ncbi:hypothetical protein Ddc_08986 [Ditylenchus destructor]|nr:hypothetical protein Ddc_08986 [Ditylenchus destructor]
MRPPPGYFPPPPSFARGIEQGLGAGFSGLPPPSITAGGRNIPYGPTNFIGGQPNQQSFSHFNGPQGQLLNTAITDRDNFHAQGCAWDGLRQRCSDIIGTCKGGCRDFSYDHVSHDCRCVPFGYAALYNGFVGGKKR